jgi:hypothetical protein
VVEELNSAIRVLLSQTNDRITNAKAMERTWKGHHADQFFGTEVPRIKNQADHLIHHMTDIVRAVGNADHAAVLAEGQWQKNPTQPTPVPSHTPPPPSTPYPTTAPIPTRPSRDGTTSAVPSDLTNWAFWASGLNKSLGVTGRHVNDAIEAFNRAPQQPQFISPVDQVGDDVIGYMARNGVIDEWVGHVGQAFIQADHKGVPSGIYRANQQDFVSGFNTASEADLAALVGDDPTKQADDAAKGTELAARLKRAEDANDTTQIRAILGQLQGQSGGFVYQFFKELGSEQTTKTLVAINQMNDDGVLQGFENTLAAASQYPNSDLNFTSTLLGSQTAKDTVTAAKANNADGVEKATRYLDQLNHKIQNGQPLTGAEIAYLQSYYDTIGPNLPDIKKWADQANCITGERAPDSHQRATQLASRVADGLLTLSQGVPYDQLPQSVRSIIDGDIGVVNPQYSDQGGRLPTSYPPSGDDNLRRYAEFMDFMDDYSSENAKPSNDLAQHLGNTAIRWKQQINVMAQNYGEHIEAANDYTVNAGDTNDAKPPSPEEWAKLFPDELSSDALGLASRNAEFSNKWITDDHAARRALLGMNWQHGSGASQVILAGTLPSNQQNDTVSAPDAARGALAVVRDTSSDYLQLAHTANSQVKATIGMLASAYVDSFAQDPSAAPGQPMVHQLELPNGQQIWGMDLDEGTHANFLKFLAASDATVYGTFRAQADGRATWYLAEALRAGHTNPGDPEYQQALSAAMRLHGSLDGAAAGALIDTADSGAKEDREKLVGQMAQMQARARAIADYKGLAEGGKFVADIVGLAPGPTGKAASVSKIALEQLTNGFLKEPESPDWGSNITNLQSYIRDLATSQRVTAAAESTMGKDMARLVARAHQDAGLPVIDPVTRRPVVPDPDGDMPESYRDGVYNSLPASLQQRGPDAMKAVIGNSPAWGSGYGQQWTTGTAGQVGSLNDASGNWSIEDDRYRIFYGNEKRMDYKPAGFWHGSEWKAEVPDEKPDTNTRPVDPNRLPTTR